jgi:hypothetical protein
MHRARLGLKVASVALLLVSLAWSGVKAVEGIIAARESLAVQSQTAFYDERYRLARERLPSTPAESRDLKRIVEVAGALGRYKTSPLATMVTLSRGLSEFPRVKIEQVEWRAAADPDATVGRSSSARDRRRGTRRVEQRQPGPAGAQFQISRVSGRIAPFEGDYRDALDTVGRFAESLRGLPGVREVEVISLPLDIGSESQLAGDASAEARVGSG